jgi:hypothetical protein
MRAACIAALLLTGCSDAAITDAAVDDASLRFVPRPAAALAAAQQWAPTTLSEAPCQGNIMDTGGLCAADFDGDGSMDLAMPRLGLPPLLFWGDGAFGWEAQELGPAMEAAGCFVADLDRDGRPDLLLTAMAAPGNRFYRNLGGRSFAEEAPARGLELAVGQAPRCLGFRSVSAADLGHDGDLDLYLSRWDLNEDSPAGRLLENDGGGRFTDITEAAGLGRATHFGYSSAFGDLDRDGSADLLLAGDFSTTQVFAGTGSGFVNLSRPWGIGTRENGMGSLLFDPDGDGDLDALITGILGDPLACGPNVPLCDGNRLYRNTIPSRSERVEADWGLADGSWGWGIALLDADNDGDEDIVQTTGYFTPFTDGADEAVLAPYRPFALDPILFFEREETGFAERGAARGLADSAEGRTALAVDLDNDGDLDLALSHNRGTVEVWETVAPASNGWLEVAALDADCQPAVGATVTLESSAGLQRRWVQANSSYLGNVLAPLHFGLGSARPLRLTVSWLDGTSTSVGVSSGNDRLTLTPAGISCP